MIFKEKKFFIKKTASLRSFSRLHQKQGFALILSVILISFCLLLAVSFLTVIQFEKTSQSQSKHNLLARKNAIFSLQEALGKLSSTTGPDQRVTARADILEETDPSHSLLTGVWVSDPASSQYGERLAWLASDAISEVNAHKIPVSASDDSKTAPLFHAIATGSASQNAVEIRLTSLRKTGNSDISTSQYAWWITEESTKARINTSPRQTTPDSSTNQGSALQNYLLDFASFSKSSPGGIDSLFSDLQSMDNEDLQRSSSFLQLPIGGTSNKKTQWQHYELDFTFHSLGLLTNNKQ